MSWKPRIPSPALEVRGRPYSTAWIWLKKLRAPLPLCFRLRFWFAVLLAALLPTRAAENAPEQSFALDGGMHGPEVAIFSEELKWLATRLPSGTVKVWNVETGQSVAEWRAGNGQGAVPGALRLHNPEVAFLRPPLQLMVAVGTNVGVHDLLTGKVERHFDPAPRYVSGLVASLAGNRAVGFLPQPPPAEPIFWNAVDGKLLSGLPTKLTPGKRPFRLPPRPGRSPETPPWIEWGSCRALSPDGQRFGVGLGDYGQIDVWDLSTGRFVTTVRPSGIPNSGDQVTSLVFLNSQRLAGVVNYRELLVFDLSAGTNAVWIPPPPPTGPSGLEIRALALSGDGQRLAVAGMRMGKRPGVLAPAGSMVFDAPMQGEVQVWDADGVMAPVILAGKPTEKFAQVALDPSGQRVAAVTTGVNYTPTMTSAMQDAEESRSTSPLSVSVWKVKKP